jgi:hypothetical protein
MGDYAELKVKIMAEIKWEPNCQAKINSGL